jgi:hypothetical protein
MPVVTLNLPLFFVLNFPLFNLRARHRDNARCQPFEFFKWTFSTLRMLRCHLTRYAISSSRIHNHQALSGFILDFHFCFDEQSYAREDKLASSIGKSPLTIFSKAGWSWAASRP